MEVSEDFRMELREGKEDRFPSYSWPGMYPYYYLTNEYQVLCPACTNKLDHEADEYDDLEIVGQDANWENESLYCEFCNAQIVCAYPSDDNDGEPNNVYDENSNF